MISKQTTLILGAGASAPFGFPTGYALLQKALSWALVGVGQTNSHIFNALGIENGEVDSFRGALSKSGKLSVDSFLEHRPEFMKVGKTVIALELIGCERESNLFKPNETHWYNYLFNELNTEFDDFGKNKLSILTFNYDRSLEHYLLTALHHSYARPLEECAAMLKSIPIIHLHGDLGGLPILEDRLVRPYRSDINNDILKIAVERIKIIHEGNEKQEQFTRAKFVLSESEVICFLGFGYHDLNMKRLGFNASAKHPDYSGAQIFGSSFGLTDAEANRISNKYRRGLRTARYDYRNLDVLQFLRETGVLFYN